MNVSIRGVILAALSAGPTVTLLFALGAWLASIPEPADFDLQSLGLLLLISMFALATGFLPALVACMLGLVPMTFLADRFDIARTNEVWVAAGALAAGGVAYALGAGGAALAFAGSGGLCAWICRRNLRFSGNSG